METETRKGIILRLQHIYLTNSNNSYNSLNYMELEK